MKIRVEKIFRKKKYVLIDGDISLFVNMAMPYEFRKPITVTISRGRKKWKEVIR